MRVDFQGMRIRPPLPGARRLSESVSHSDFDDMSL
jgi:hypothetical protein